MRCSLACVTLAAANVFVLFTLGCGLFSNEFTVPSPAMTPSILSGESVQWAPTQEEIRRGDIVLYKAPKMNASSVSRIVGEPGDTIRVMHHRVTINESPATYTQLEDATWTDRTCMTRTSTRFRESISGVTYDVLIPIGRERRLPFNEDITVEVPPNHYFVLGDHRAASSDSRSWGVLSREQIQGVVTQIDASKDACGLDPRAGRAGTDLRLQSIPK